MTKYYWLAEEFGFTGKYVPKKGYKLTSDAYDALWFNSEKQCSEFCTVHNQGDKAFVPVQHGFEVSSVIRQAIDTLALCLADHHHVWTNLERKLYGDAIRELDEMKKSENKNEKIAYKDPVFRGAQELFIIR